MAKKASWPKIKFSGCGKKPSSELVRRVDPFRGMEYFDFLQNWNGGTPTDGSFKVLGVDGNPTLAAVKYFFGVTDDCGPSDIRSAVYRYWDYLPRGALPIAEVEIEDDEYDQCLLITFRWGERYNQVFLLANPHECAGDPDDVRDLKKLASSLPPFLSNLQSWQYYNYRAWYQLPVPVDQLKSVADKLLEFGCVDHYQHFEDIQDRKCSLAYHAEIGFGIWLAHPKEKMWICIETQAGSLGYD